MTFYRLTLKSANGKTGPIPVSTTSSDSCPPSCALKEVCYAKGGPLAIVWKQVDAGRFSTGIDGFCAKIALLPDEQLWRHDQAGDLPGKGDRIDREDTLKIAHANRGKRGFTYTHKPVLPGSKVYKANSAIIAEANKAGFTINLSGNNLEHADRLADLKIAPVVTLLPVEYGRKEKGGEWVESLEEWRARVPQDIRTASGRSVKPCPATWMDTNCAACGLCQRQARKVIVGFPGHGAGKGKADAIAKAAA